MSPAEPAILREHGGRELRLVKDARPSFPAALSDKQDTAAYYLEAKLDMRLWAFVQWELMEPRPTTEHETWTRLTDAAVEAVDRKLYRPEQVLVTLTAKYTFNAKTRLDIAERLHRPGRLW